MIEKTGDLLNSGLPAIGHGTNCRGVMGAGIAKQIKERWPGIMTDYKALCDAHGPDLLGAAQIYSPGTFSDPVIVNLFTQVDTGPNADLDAVWESVTAACQELIEMGITRLGLPEIGCGIGGLHWEDVKDVLLDVEYEYIDDIELVVVHYK